MTDFKTLVQKAQNGDSEAFSLLYTDLYTPLFKYILSRTKNRPQAEDLVQDVFVKFLQNIHNYTSERDTPLPYLFTIAHNLIINSALKKKPDLFVEDEAENIPSSELGQLETLANTEEFEMVISSLEELPTDQAEVLRLRYLSELSTKEIAEVLKKNEANIRKIESRGLQKLRELLKEKTQ